MVWQVVDHKLSNPKGTHPLMALVDRVLPTMIAVYPPQFEVIYPTTGFAAALANLGPTSATGCATPNSTTGCFIDWTLASATAAATAKNGYIYNVANAVSATSFQAAAAAANWNQTGIRSFCAVADGVPRAKVETATVAPTAYPGA